MPEEQSSNLKAIIRWAGGIIAAVLTAVLTAVLIARLNPSPKPAPTDVTTNPAPTLDINGYVLDSSTRAAVRNANVTLALGKLSGHQRTDLTGKYRIILTEPVAQAVMTDVNVTAPGYQPFQNTLAVSPPGGYNEIYIDAETPPPAPAKPGAPPAVPDAKQNGAAVVPPPMRHAMILTKPFPSGFIKGAAATMSRSTTPARP